MSTSLPLSAIPLRTFWFKGVWNVKKYFSFSLYREGLKRVRGSGVASAIVLVTLVGVRILLYWGVNVGLKLGERELLGVSEAMPFAYAIIALAPIIVMRMFSFLNNRSASDFYHSIPQKRICLFLSFFAAALTWVVGIVLVAGLVCYVGWNCTLRYAVGLATVAKCVVSYTALGLLSASCMALAVSFTGNGFSTIFAFVCIFGMPPLLINVLGLFVREFNASIVLSQSVFRFFGTRGFLPLALMNGSFYEPFGLPVVSSFVIFLLLTALAAFAFVKRKSETAGNSTATPLLQHVLRCCAGFPIWLLIAYLFMIDEKAVGLALVPASLAIYIVYELITTRRLKNVAQSLPVFLALPLLCLAFVGTAKLGGTIVSATTPQSAEEVSYAVIIEDGFYLNEYPLKRIYNTELTDGDVIDSLLYGVDHADSYENFIIKMKLKNGKTVYRRIGLYGEGFTRFLNEILNDDECSKELLELPAYENIFNGELDSYSWQIFTAEYNALTNEQKLSVYGYDDGEGRKTFEVTEYGENGSKIHIWYHIDKTLFPRTYELIYEFIYD